MVVRKMAVSEVCGAWMEKEQNYGKIAPDDANQVVQNI